MSPILPGIEHIVVLMFENRSFDNMLGGLYPELSQNGSYHGLTGKEWNPDPHSNNEPVFVWQGPSAHDTLIMPYPDPGESFDDIHQQIYGASTSGPKTMQGFVANYLQQPPSPDGISPVAQNIMHYHAPGPAGTIPITSALASAYAVSDLWFASGPVQTLANRTFAHCATPSVYQQDEAWYAVLNNTDITHRHINPFGAVVDTPVFQLLDQAAKASAWPWPNRVPWKMYFHDLPVSAMIKYVDDSWASFEGGRVHLFERFADDVASELPTYSFLEPCYTDYFGGTPNSNHPGGSTLHMAPPPVSVYDGEMLLKDVYSTLYNAPGDLFARTLLVIIYDEHGGTYDHLPPQLARSPFPPGFVTGYDYSDYGVRVPAVFINPSIQPGTIFRPPPGGPPFDHTSLISTLRAQFGLGGPLTRRDESAPTLEGLVDPAWPRNPFSPDNLPQLSAPPPAAPFATVLQSLELVPKPDSLAAAIKQAIESPRNQGRVQRQMAAANQ